MSVVTRFAPAPSGRLHVGNLRTALHSWLLAKKTHGRFLLRIDDTDASRSREECVGWIRDDLTWLGLAWDGEVRQSQRLALYDAALDRLAGEGRAYRCYESQQELELKRKVLLGRGLPPIYDRAALTLSEADHAAREAAGEAPHWRFRLDHAAPIAWHDAIRGPQRFDPAQLSDPVIRRADGTWLYMLPSVVDDIDLAVSDIVRGEDHVSNTALQLQMFQALGAPVPRFAHAALIVGGEGVLSKRLGSLGIEGLREMGIEPQALVALLARIGTSQPVDPSLDAEALAARFDLADFGRAPAQFDEAELQRVNAAVVHALPFEAVADRLPDGMGETAWVAIRANLSRVEEAGAWWQVVTGPVPPPDLAVDDCAFLAQATAVVADLDWHGDPWAQLTAALKAATGRKGKALFLPLRTALTGRDHGPEMATLLPLIGREEAARRLAAAAGATPAAPSPGASTPA